MSHILDRPIWSALNSRHALLAEGGELARRYQPSISLFAAAHDDSEECLDALGALAGPEEGLLLVQADRIALPAGFAPAQSFSVVQMIAVRPPEPVADKRIVRLAETDAAEMLDLATLTKPGPFSLRAQALGEFWGVKDNGALIAMAGERLKQPGLTELSGVCVHPDQRGRGLGRLLSLFVAGRIFERRETPYLHAYATNSAAVRLYESIGFSMRTTLNGALIRRE